MKEILFVCTGNYYRSRLAELYFNTMAQKKGLPWQAFSVGTEADQNHNEGPISIHTIDACIKFNITLPTPYRYPVQISESYLHKAEIVVLINKEEHFPHLQLHFPAFAQAAIAWQILDVEYEKPESAIGALLKKVELLIEQIANHEQKSD